MRVEEREKGRKRKQKPKAKGEEEGGKKENRGNFPFVLFCSWCPDFPSASCPPNNLNFHDFRCGFLAYESLRYRPDLSSIL